MAEAAAAAAAAAAAPPAAQPAADVPAAGSFEEAQQRLTAALAAVAALEEAKLERAALQNELDAVKSDLATVKAAQQQGQGASGGGMLPSINPGTGGGMPVGSCLSRVPIQPRGIVGGSGFGANARGLGLG